jgi:hypothetical protein
MYAHTQTFHPKDHGRSIVHASLAKHPTSNFLWRKFFTLIPRWGITPRALAHMLDSLVRVSRRDDKRHFVRVPRAAWRLASAHSGPNPLSHALKEASLAAATSDHRQHCLPSVPFQQFQVLFHSLFKVLFIFPSRYLFAIGLPPIFSFRWNLPPA